MPVDGPQDRNMYQIVTKLIKFVVVYSNTIGSIDILHHNKISVTKKLKTIILYLFLTILFIHNNNNLYLTQKHVVRIFYAIFRQVYTDIFKTY
jgi:hypothetical protein